ncbi:MAG: hypothetical protein HQL88_03090 [Magnetococcales bacterium]|nr:hypothetical protein [Magnetococcales bacterium]
MKEEENETLDPKRLEQLPAVSLAEAAWMAGVTTDSFERFLDAATLSHLRALPLLELVRGCFTLLGQREAQLAMFRLQLAAALQREKELAEALHSKLTAHLETAFLPPVANILPPPGRPAPAPPASVTAPPPFPARTDKKRGKKK